MKFVSQPYETPAVKTLAISSFTGIDLHSSPCNVALTRSPDAPNMVRDVPGKVRKRMGYYKFAQYDGRINGVHTLRSSGEPQTLIHAGTKLYKLGDSTPLSTAMADGFSRSWQIGAKLYIADGGLFRVYDGSTLQAVESGAYVPTVHIGRGPSGGGTAYEPLNLIGDCWSESFLSDGSSTVYQLSFSDLSSAGDVSAKRLVYADTWQDYVNGVDFTVNASTGTVSFVSAVPAPIVAGQDNLVITAKKVRAGYKARINGCTFGALFGVNGAADRLFLSGNPGMANTDWHSGLSDPTYFPETGYCELGQDSCIVGGYTIVDNKLAAHKLRDDDNRNIVIREGTMVDGVAAFPIVNSLIGAPAASKNCFLQVSTEPMFFSSEGVFAITAKDITGERYTQNRSYYINNALAAQENPENAYACFYNDYCVIALNNKLFLVDTLSKSYEKDEPHSQFQYECFLCTDVPARLVWNDGSLCFGTADGSIMKFYRDSEALSSYSDCGAAISAYWTLPDFSDDSFYYRKTIRNISVMMMAAAATSMTVFAKVKGIWEQLFAEDDKARYLKFSNLIFSRFSFSCDTAPCAVFKKLSLRRLSSVQFRFSNSVLNEPFGIFEIGMEYQLNGYVKE